MDEGDVEAADGAGRACHHQCVIVASAVPYLTTDHPLLDASFVELVGIRVISLHRSIISSKEDLIESLIV